MHRDLCVVCVCVSVQQPASIIKGGANPSVYPEWKKIAYEGRLLPTLIRLSKSFLTVCVFKLPKKSWQCENHISGRDEFRQTIFTREGRKTLMWNKSGVFDEYSGMLPLLGVHIELNNSIPKRFILLAWRRPASTELRGRKATHRPSKIFSDQ